MKYVDRENAINNEIIFSCIGAARSINSDEVFVTRVSHEGSALGNDSRTATFDLPDGSSLTMIYYPKKKESI